MKKDLIFVGTIPFYLFFFIVFMVIIVILYKEYFIVAWDKNYSFKQKKYTLNVIVFGICAMIVGVLATSIKILELCQN